MADIARVTFEVPPIEEREEIILSGNTMASQTNGIGSAAERAATVAHLVLGVDKQAAEDTLQTFNFLLAPVVTNLELGALY